MSPLDDRAPPINYHLEADGLSALMILLAGFFNAAISAGFME